MEKLCDFLLQVLKPGGVRSKLERGKKIFKIDMRYKFGLRKIWSFMYEN